MDVLVAADDRTGACEAAAALVERGAGPVGVTAWPAMPSATAGVVDLATRHLSPADAFDRAGRLPTASRQMHKIDSTLRGNWADELAARARAAPVLLVPALPVEGRVCVDGMVVEHGRPVHEGAAGSDVRRRVVTSRPADALRAASVDEVVACSTPGDVVAWLDEPSGVAVADAADDAAIESIADRWRERSGVVLAGTSAVLGAGFGRRPDGPVDAEPPAIAGPVLIVCGSVHPAARRQVEAAARRGVPVAAIADSVTARTLADHGALVLVSEIPVGDVDEPMAVAAVANLARGVATLLDSVEVGAVALIGGDTAAAVLDSVELVVRGWVVPGVAWATAPGWDVPIVTRSGGFGGDAALLDLLRALGAR